MSRSGASEEAVVVEVTEMMLLEECELWTVLSEGHFEELQAGKGVGSSSVSVDGCCEESGRGLGEDEATGVQSSGGRADTTDADATALR
jgi:hypothetical protein